MLDFVIIAKWSCQYKMNLFAGTSREPLLAKNNLIFGVAKWWSEWADSWLPSANSFSFYRTWRSKITELGTQTQDGYHKWNGISSRMQLWLGGVLVIVEFSFVMNNVCSPCQKGREKKWRDAQYNGLMHQWRRAVSGQIFCGSFILLRFISDNFQYSRHLVQCKSLWIQIYHEPQPPNINWIKWFLP